eukprot:CAMPEP_0182464258 /NCGR_PEP_ID=MMETSP1319-20130603/8439_1 /TAXON_ID=172717 /ORGANISM="Bolidomonas pacifica, Strain RCC208" /LENGTH=86 /DNA_ID=CAMNT_0024663891 /DNA_START=246 /DNA_END=503 /DNA_ORIENTATION=-
MAHILLMWCCLCCSDSSSSSNDSSNAGESTALRPGLVASLGLGRRGPRQRRTSDDAGAYEMMPDDYDDDDDAEAEEGREGDGGGEG